MGKTRYAVHLTEEERSQLKDRVRHGGDGWDVTHAQVLLRLDEIPENEGWSVGRIASAFRVSQAFVSETGRTYVVEGLDAAILRKPRKHKAMDEKLLDALVEIMRSEPPEGAKRWTKAAIRRELVRRRAVDCIDKRILNEALAIAQEQGRL